MYKNYAYELNEFGKIIQEPNHKGMIVSQNTFGLLLADEFFNEGFVNYEFSYRLCDTESSTIDWWKKMYFERLVEMLNRIDWNKI